MFTERTSVGLDVHARSVVAAAIDGVTGELVQARLTPAYGHIRSWVQELPGPVAGGLRGSWGAAPAEGLEAQDGDYVVEKMRMSAWQGTRLENLLAGLGRDTIIVTGAWTNMSIEHTSRTGADKGYFMVVPEDGCSTMNADWHNASINYALQNVSTVNTCAAVTEALAGVPAGV